MQDSGRDQSDERIASLVGSPIGRVCARMTRARLTLSGAQFKRLDTKNEGHLDVEGLRAGLKKINHRKLHHGAVRRTQKLPL